VTVPVLPDAEALAVAYLTRCLAGTTVSTRLPNPLPDRYVRVRRTGGYAPNRVLDEAQLTLECYGPDTVTAYGLARTVQHHMHTAASSSAIRLARGTSTVGGPYYDPDPVSGCERYTLTVRVVLRGTTTQ
jgi:hypothetical protein